MLRHVINKEWVTFLVIGVNMENGLLLYFLTFTPRFYLLVLHQGNPTVYSELFLIRPDVGRQKSLFASIS